MNRKEINLFDKQTKTFDMLEIDNRRGNWSILLSQYDTKYGKNS